MRRLTNFEKLIILFQILFAFSENLNFNYYFYKKIPVFCFSRQKHEIKSFVFILILHASFSRVFIDVNCKRIFDKMLEISDIQVSFWLEKWKMKIGTSSFAVELHLWQSSKWSWKFSNWMSRAGWLLPKLYIPITIK